MSLSRNPVYNLKAVLLETNITADTLRAWERRYGLPMPHRSAGGHRLYSQHDIETIKWLMARQAEGFSISRAVDSWNEKTAAGFDPLEEFLQAANTPQQASLALSPTMTYNLEVLRSQWIAACLKYDELHAEQVLNQAFSVFPVEAVCTEILQIGLAEIGGLWYENRASVQQEHFASGLAMRRLDALLSSSPIPTRNQALVVGCPPGEWHTFIPLLLSLFLRRRGLNVIYLGANVPADRFEDTLASTHARLVLLVSQTLVGAAALQLIAPILSRRHAQIGFGGRIFNLQPGLANRISGHYLGMSIHSAIDEIEKILKGKARTHTPRTASREYLSAHHAFLAKRSHIEGTLREAIQSQSISPEGLNTGIQHLGDNIAAALQLGDMEYITSEMEWLKNLLQAHKRPARELAEFMKLYSRAVDKHITGQGGPIKEWLSAQAARE